MIKIQTKNGENNFKTKQMKIKIKQDKLIILKMLMDKFGLSKKQAEKKLKQWKI